MQQSVELCCPPKCHPPVPDSADYCCLCPELAAELNDPAMPVDDPPECKLPVNKFFNRF